MADSDPYIDRLLDNRYEIKELIGKGAMGRVYMAKHTLLEGQVAIKFLSNTLLTQKMKDRFFQEARTCAQLGQKTIHIVRVTDFGIDVNQDVPFYVMEYLQGDSLAEVLQLQPLALPRFLGIARQICLGLKYAHEGIEVDGKICPIIHRDVKPSNILVMPDETMGDLVKVLDFGISQLQSEDHEGTKTFMGTLAYASPEQMEGKEIDPRSDLYSFGIMMFQMLTGKLPLSPESHSFGGWYKAHHFQTATRVDLVAPQIKAPKILDSLLMACLEKEPSKRPSNAAEVLEELEKLDERFRQGRQLGHRIKDVLAKKPVGRAVRGTEPGETSDQPVNYEKLCYLQSWPKDKPVARITFPQVIPTSQAQLASLWAMLSKAEIDEIRTHRLYNRVYRNFLCTMSPHPIVLWLTAIYNQRCHQDSGPRWLYAFLDLKTTQSIELLQILGTQAEYRLLMFALEEPQRCAYVLSPKVNDLLSKQLRQWVMTARNQPSVGSASMSKDLLRSEFHKLKPKIQQRMAVHQDPGATDLTFGSIRMPTSNHPTEQG
ncbi:serine/threonine protein kinase [Prochlorothrix hollandica]|uniref:non-specific serine/threonine protein kinase n=1 Tax=Prochlorothrix hollandica PCC 9006 = CALU 1027 TaxID=317619 RepID=A0A0M2PY36_PROHO|nr:serine/threonine-protein kinase [Prochlorothrix hollandica]KKJ01331.1 serine/threonine protein kinase [Prochlorothrix hollandica PCC 9006 = CALU 1027]